MGLVAVAFLATGPQFSTAFGQGVLNPSGPPGPTMKALDQIASSGVVINSVNTPGNSNYKFIISAPGNYYLSGNVSMVSSNAGCILVATSGVSIDLNGFRLSGSGSHGYGDGIDIDVFSDDCTIRNGTIVAFNIGVNCLVGFGGRAARGVTLSGITASSCDEGLIIGGGSRAEFCNAHDNYTGIAIADNGSTVSHCVMMNNGGYGIYATYLSGCSILDCSAYNCGAGISCYSSVGCNVINCNATTNLDDGIDVGSGGTAVNCTVYNNGSDGIYSEGYSTITGCTCVGQAFSGIHAQDGSTITGCTASQNGEEGIFAGTGCTILNNNVSYNKLDGIQVTSSCSLLHNTASYNTRDGIRSIGVNNRIDSNTAMSNSGTGIHSTYSSTADYIMRNLAYSNIANYNPVSGTFFGPYSTPGTATSPWADF